MFGKAGRVGVNFLILVLCGSLGVTKGECDIQYLKEPVTSLSCNPYLQNSILRLQCNIWPLIPITNNAISIQWFFSSGVGNPTPLSGTFPPFLQVDQHSSSQNGVITSIMSLNGSLLDSPAFIGSYYCQVSHNRVLYLPSAMLMLEPSASFSNLQPCGNIQAQNSTRCAHNTPSQAPPMAESQSSSSAAGFNIGAIEEDIHIGIYLLIFLLVVALGLSTVVIMVFLGRRCDKRKKNSTSQEGASSQPQLEAVVTSDMEMQKLDSSLKTNNGSKKADEADTSKLDTISLEEKSSMRGRLDTYTSMKGFEDKYVGIDTAQPKSSVLLSPLPPKPLKDGIEVIENANAKKIEDIYEELPENSQDFKEAGDKRKIGGTGKPKEEDLTGTSTSEIWSNHYIAMDGNRSRVPEIPARDKKVSNKPPPPPIPLLSKASDSSMKLKTTTNSESPPLPTRMPPKPFKPIPQPKEMDDLVVYDDMSGTNGNSSPQDTQAAFVENNYDVIPAEAGVMHNPSYGAFRENSRTTEENNPDNIYEALDQDECLYTAMS